MTIRDSSIRVFCTYTVCTLERVWDRIYTSSLPCVLPRTIAQGQANHLISRSDKLNPSRLRLTKQANKYNPSSKKVAAEHIGQAEVSRADSLQMTTCA